MKNIKKRNNNNIKMNLNIKSFGLIWFLRDNLIRVVILRVYGHISAKLVNRSSFFMGGNLMGNLIKCQIF